MPGHDKSKIVVRNPDDLDEFICGICQAVLNKPVVTQCCRQSYCKDCIEEWLRGHDTCPNDRQTLTIDGVYEASRLVINLIDKLQIKCDFSDKGCPEVTTIGTKVDHYKTCTFNKCATCGRLGMGNDDDDLALLTKRNVELTEIIDNLRKEKLSIENERDELLASRPSEEMRYHVTLASAITEAQGRSHRDLSPSRRIVANNHVCPEWKESMIEICDDAIAGFNPKRPDDSRFVEGILAKIVWKKFRTDLNWKVTAEVKDCSVSESEVGDRCNFSLQLAYDNLIIDMSASKKEVE